VTPVIVVGGWLGAGKTTLVNHLLRQAQGRRLAVLVNDFGDCVIDAELIDRAAGPADVLALAGGCICCAYGADLLSALQRVQAREPAPDLVLIEASGVALPQAVVRTVRLDRGLAVDGTVLLADASTLAAQARDPYVGDTVRAQLQQADLLLLNHVDRASASVLAAARALQPGGVPVVDTVQAAVPAELLFGLLPRRQEQARDGDAEASARRPLRPWRPHSAASEFTSELRRLAPPVDLQALQAELAMLPGLLRAKGFVHTADGRRWCLQAVGRRVEVRLHPVGGPSPADDVLLVVRHRGSG
jgi:G3E family GTPase